MNTPINTTIGDLIAEVYSAFIEIYGDEELARYGTSMLIERLLQRAPLALAA
jgi:hypothetical protein